MFRDMKTGTKRQYTSRLRNRQKDLTRDAILKAIEKLLLAEGLEGFSVPKVAAKAGASVKTIYRYFPTRQALLDAAATWFAERLFSQRPSKAEMLATPEQLVNNISWAMDSYDRHPALVKVFHTTDAGREIRRSGIQHTIEHRTLLMKRVNTNLSDKEALKLAALFQILMSTETWEQFREIWGIKGEEAAPVLQWAARIILGELERGVTVDSTKKGEKRNDKRI